MPKILAIDDINDNLISLKAIVSDAFPNSVVFTALNGTKGIELAIEINPDVILLDVIMPEMDGFEVCRRLKLDERLRDIPVVFLTALKGDKENRIKALEVGAEGFLSKPIDEIELIAQIQAMVKIKAASEQKRNEKERLKKLVEERTRELKKSQAATLKLLNDLKAENEVRLKTEETLQNSEERFRNIFNISPDSVAISEIETGKYIDVNSSFEKLSGFKKEEIIGKTSYELGLWIDNSQREIYIDILNSKGEINNLEITFRKKDGNLVHTLASTRIIETSGKLLMLNVIKDITERKLAQEAIREREERFRLISSSISDLSYSCIINKSGNSEIDWLYGPAEKITGYTNDELFDMKCWGKLVVDEDFRIFKAHILDDFPDKTGVFELRLRRKDGSIFWVQATAECIKGSDGDGSRIIYGGLIDITERKKAEESLRESEQQFREFFLNASDAIFVAELESGILVDANRAASRLLLMQHDQIIGLHQSQLHPPNKQKYSKETFRDHKKSLVQEDIAIPFENQVIRPDGSLIPVEILAAEVMYKGKKCLLGTFRDITERKQAEEALRESEEKYRLMVDLSPDAIIIHTEGKVVFANASAIRSIGLSCLDQLIGKTVFDFVHPDCKDLIMKRINEIYNSGKPSGYTEEKFITFNNTILDAEVIGIPVNYKGQPAIQTILRDITERKRAEAALWESQINFKALFEKGPIGVAYHQMIYDETGKPIDYLFLDANQSYQKLTGVNPVGKLVTEAFPGIENDPFDWIGTFGEVAKTGKEVRFQQYLQSNNRWYDCVGYQYKPDHFVAAFFEITEKKLAEDKINSIFRVAPTGIGFIVNRVIIEVNPRITEMTGFSKEELIGQSSRMLYPTKEEFDLVGQEKYNQIAIQGTGVVETRWQKKDGAIIHILLSSTPVDQADISKGVIFTALDITSRKLAEESLLESQQLFKGLFNASPDAIVLIDPHHSGTLWLIIDCNEASCQMNGYTREEMIGRSIDLINIESGSIAERKNYFNELREKGVIHLESFHRHKDGHIFPIEVSTSLINIGGREMVLGIDRDITARKQAENELKNSEERYRSFISQVSEGVYRFESDEPMDISLPVEEQIDFVYDHMFVAECNQSFLKMYGVTNEQVIIGKGPLEFHGGRNNQVNRQTFRTFINNGYRVQNAITEETNSLGQTVYISNNSLGIIENNKLVRLWGTQTDVTEKIRADQVQEVLFSISNAALSSISLPEMIELISREVGRLIDSTNFYIAFYDEKTDMLSTIYERDEKDVIETWPAENSITGYVIKQQKSILLREEDVDQLYRNSGIQQFGTPAKVWLGVPMMTNKKTIGAIVVQSYNNPDAYSEKDKQMLEFISHQISISIERKKTEQDLKLLGKAFDQSPVTIVITNKEGNIEYVNPKFTYSTGYTLDEVKGYNPRIIQSGNQSREFYQGLWETILAGNDWFGEFQNRRKNGEYYWESAVISPITNENGQIEFFLAIKEDITEKKKMIDDLIHARNKAEESDRLKSSFLANMSHEIRTPLNSIIGFSELLLDEDFGAEQHEEFARMINVGGNSLLTIISDIMDLSKIEAGQIQVIRKNFLVNKLIREIQSEYSFKASEKGLILRLNPENPVNEIVLDSDEQRIKQVLVNFIGNAIKFTEKGFIEIGIHVSGESIKFQIKDTGIGIPEAFHQQIFERFRQVETAYTRKYGGNGLGLAISKNLIELLGGEIGMESETGKGSTFYFTIPVT